MNISTSNSAAAGMAQASESVSNTSSKNTSDKSKSDNEKSFKEEMENVSSKTDSKAEENKESEKASAKNEPEKEADGEMYSAAGLNGNISFTDFKYIAGETLLSKNIMELTNVREMMSGFDKISFSYESIKMSDDDAMFFANLVKNTNMSMQGIAAEIQQTMEADIQATQASSRVSATLMNALSDSMKTGQPVRIDFDKDISVIIRIDKNGSITASFIPGDKAVEQYLKDNIGFLKQKFDDENISYNELNYKQSRDRQENDRQKNNKESNDE